MNKIELARRAGTDGATTVPRLLRRWAPKASSALLDQGLASGTNFIVNVLLARWLQQTDYGAFAVGYASYLVIGGAYNALLFEPIGVFGPTAYAHWQKHYQRCMGAAHALLSVSLAVLGALASLVFVSAPVRIAILTVSASVGALASLTLARRLCYLEGAPWLAAKASAFYCVTTMLLVCGMKLLGFLTWWSSFLSLAAASLAAALYTWPKLQRAQQESSNQAVSMPGLADIARRHWGYGRWVLISATLTPFLSQWQLTVTVERLSLASAGVYKAIMNATLPMTQGVAAMSLLILPILSRIGEDQGPRATAIAAAKISGIMLGAACLYELALVLWHESVRNLLYGSRMQFDSRLIAVAGLVPVFVAAGSCAGQMLKALNHPGRLVAVEALSALVAVPVTVLLTVRLGLPGAIWSTVVFQAVWASVVVTAASATGLREQT